MTNMATDDAKPWVNEGGSRKGRGERGTKNIPKMATDDAKALVNEGGSRTGRGREGNTQTDQNGDGYDDHITRTTLANFLFL